MKAIILAAGMGERLMPLTKDRPKPMVELLGRVFIEYALDALAEKKVSGIVIAVGYQKQVIMETFGNSYKGINLTYVHNDNYQNANNIYSLKLALEKIDEDLMLCEGDIVFEPKILHVIDANRTKNLVFVAKYKPHMKGTVIKYDKSSKRITDMIDVDSQGEGFEYSEVYKTVNLYYLTYDFLKRHFKPALKRYIANHGMSGQYELILKALLSTYNRDIYAYDVGDAKWFEIDDSNDLRMAEDVFGR